MTRLFRRLVLLFRRNRFHSELEEEMAFHRAQAEKELSADGMSPKAARIAATRLFGNELRLREESHEAIEFRFESVWQDVRYAVRQMMRSPGFTLAVVLTLALGIGANTAIFSVVHATLLRPLPYPEAERIITIQDVKKLGKSTGGLVTVPRFFDLEERGQSFESLACFYFEHPTLIFGVHPPQQIAGVAATGEFWRVMGAQPMMGRTFNAGDDRPQAAEVVVLSYAAWQRYLGADRDVIGKLVRLDDKSATVIGVMPESFHYPGRAGVGVDIWRPAHYDAANWKSYRGDGVRFVMLVGRLKQGVSYAAARNELQGIGAQLATEHPETDGPWEFGDRSLRDDLYGQMRPALLVLLAASAVLLLIACLNVANLLLSRAAGRQREVALRQALGASRTRIARQLLTETLLLALLGGLVGLSSAFGLVRIAASKLPPALGLKGTITLDWQVAGFALMVSAIAGIVFGLVPVLQGRRGDLNRSLKSGEAQIAGSGGGGGRNAFIAAQVGLSLMLLVFSILLVQSLRNLTNSPLGFIPDHALTFQIEVPWGWKAASTDRFFDEVQRRVEALPGVAAAGQISALPMAPFHSRSSFDVDWKPRTAHKDAVSAELRHIEGDYLGAMRIPLLAGRSLREGDGAVVLVNQEFARRYLPEGSPLGMHLLGDNSLEIVGVIGNVRGTAGSIAGAVEPEVYDPERGLTNRSFVVRTRMAPEELITAVERQVHQVDPLQAVGHVRTLDEMVNEDVAQPRLNMALIASFAAIALLLACVGFYGVVAYSVAQRRREIGVRMALGASRGQISGLFLKQTLASALIGLVCGGIATLMVVRLLRSQLYGISPYDLPTFASAVFLLLLPVLLASLRPTLRAASVNPVEALRAE